jgi:protein transport protein SEC24
MGFGPPPPQPPGPNNMGGRMMAPPPPQQQQQGPTPGVGFMQPKPPMGFVPPQPASPGLNNSGRPVTNVPGQGPPPPSNMVGSSYNDPNMSNGTPAPMMNPMQPKQFYPQQPVPPGMAQMVPGSVPPPQQQQQLSQMSGATTAVGAGGLPNMAMNENIDYNVTIPHNLCRWTASKLPSTAAMASSTKIPLGAILRPLAPEPIESESSIPTVQPGTAGIVRCKRCRTYINAFVTWSEHGRRWRCNICAQINDCPSAYFCHLDELGLRRDRFERPELSHSVVEFVAPAEYMVRPPQEPTYFFVIDTSATAVRSGMLASTSAAIKASLDNLPGAGRTKIGFITFD